MRYLLFTVGTIGDLNPYLWIGAALKQAGHNVSLITSAPHRAIVENEGLECLELDDNIAAAYVDHPDFFQPAATWKLALKHCFVGPMRQTYATIKDYASREEVALVSAAWGFGARIAAEKLGLPLVTIHLEPHNIRSVHQSPLMPPLLMGRYVPRWFKQLQFLIADRFFIDPEIAPAVNRFRQELGLPPVKRLLAEWWNSPQKIIGMYPGWFSLPQPDWPAQLELAGFPNALEKQPSQQAAQQAAQQQPAESCAAVQFARQNQPLVFTAGSNRQRAKEHFATAVACCKQLGRCGVLLTKEKIDIPAAQQQQVKQFEYVAFDSLLPHAAAIVHHAGAGTTAAALRWGVPQLVTPGVHGTPDIARRLQQLGAGRIVHAGRFQPATVSAALHGLLADKSIALQCKSLQLKMADENATQRACDIIQKTCGGK